MSAEERAKKVAELKAELMRERGMAAMGGAPTSPGKIRALRRTISRRFGDWGIISAQLQQASVDRRRSALGIRAPHREVPG